MRLYVVFIFLIVMVTAGCTNATTNESSSPSNKNQKVRVQQSIPPKPDIQNSDEVVVRLEELAKSVPHVTDANCVVIGNTAIVGINVAGNLDRARVGTIKYSVAEALRKDPVGIHAIVTADIDIGNRLREMNNDIRNGHPVSGFAQELADIFGRIIPQLPQDVEAPQNQNQNQNQPSS